MRSFAALSAQFFPHVTLSFENHGVRRVSNRMNASMPPTRISRAERRPAKRNFYIAVCSLQPVDVPSFVYVPKPPNVLENSAVQHTSGSRTSLQQKNDWLAEAQTEHAELVRLHDAADARARSASNIWAEELDTKLKSSRRAHRATSGRAAGAAAGER